MNLVQINERLKDLPVQVLQQYANGMNPEVPPYLALGELQRREMSQKQMATAQGGQQGPQPSIKEQVEQKAGLMALQQMQQQQVAQQMQQPRGPMPAPAGVPQPEPQPEAMMARGGLAGIPVRRDMFEYAGGGIIAFQAGGQPKYETRYDKMNRENRERAEEEKKRESERPIDAQAAEDRAAVARLLESLRGGSETAGRAIADVATMIPRGLVGAYDTAVVRPMRAAGVNAAYLSPKLTPEGANPESMTPFTDVARQRDGAQSAPRASQVVQTGSPDIPSGLPAALAKAGPASANRQAPPVAGASPMPGAPRPAAPAQAGAPAGIAAALPQGNASPFMAEAAAAARERPVAPTPASIIAEQNQLLPAGMKEEAMQKMFADQRARAEGRQAAYEKSKPSGLDDLIRVFGQAGQYKGLSGLAPAETALQQQRRAEDLAMQKQQDELLTAIEGRQYGADKELFGAREKSMSAANKSFQDRLMTNTKTLADLAGVDQRRMDEAAQRLTQMQIAKLQAATANRPSEAERIEATYMGMIAKGQAKEAEEYLARISKIKGGAGGDRNPTPTDRLRAAQSIMNDIDSTAEEKAMAKKEIAGIMAGSKPTGESNAAGVPLPPNASAKNLTVGTVYQTAKGPAKWTGTGFMPI